MQSFTFSTHALLASCSVIVLLSACGTAPKSSAPKTAPVSQTRSGSAEVASTGKTERALPSLPAAGSGRGGYYQDDGPGDAPPAGLYEVPDAEPRLEPLAKTGNKAYVVFGKTYVPLTDDRPYVQRGIGSWYGKKFHGQRTSSGEPYDMYKMTAAHPLLPIPSYARVTNLINGKQVIVKVNDRGPFHSGRIIDLSYTAALKLGLLGKGSHEVEVERLLPEEIARLNARKNSDVARKNDVDLPRRTPDVQVANRPAPEKTPLLALSEKDARQIRDLDRALHSAPLLPAPTTYAVPAPEVSEVLLAENGVATPATSSLRFDQNIAPLGQKEEAAAVSGNLAGGAFYLQLGAFSQAENAEAERAKLAQTSLPSVEVVQAGRVFRLYSGPFASRAQAQQAALLAQNGKALIVQR